MPDLAVIVLNWNDAEATINCCQSVVNASRFAADRLASVVVYVVDNGSGESDVAALSCWLALQPTGLFRLVRNNRNLGFSGGMNAGIELALATDPDYVWLLNNDLEVDETCIGALLRFAEDRPDVAVAGATAVDPETDRVQTAGGYRYFPALGYNRPIKAGLSMSHLESIEVEQPDYINGAALWLRGDFIRRLGGLPSRHFLYFEELELNHRLAGKESIGWCRQAVVFHQQGGSLVTPALQEFATYHAALSAFTYTRDHYPLYLVSVIATRLVGIAGRATFRGQPGLLAAVFRALLDFLRSGDSPGGVNL